MFYFDLTIQNVALGNVEMKKMLIRRLTIAEDLGGIDTDGFHSIFLTQDPLNNKLLSSQSLISFSSSSFHVGK